MMFGSFSDLAFLGVAAGTGVALDPDAQSYITAVETVDGQALEAGVRAAINDFVVGCKADGIWTAIKASCILAGARTRLGAMVPLVGAAPTSFNFVDADYNRKTGLVGDGSTKYLATSNAPVRNNFHASVHASALSSPGLGSGNFSALIAARSPSIADGSVQIIDVGTTGSPPNTIAFVANSPAVNRNESTGFIGMSRSLSTQSTDRVGGVTNTNVADTDATTTTTPFDVFRRSNGAYTLSRLAFYSIGESLNLALLDARVTDLINAFGAAIP
jgi:hypothetical protein